MTTIATGLGPAAGPGGPCLHQLFEAHAERSPQAPAIEAPGQDVTYGQLEQAANHLAGTLAASGLAPDRPVILYGRPAPEMLLGLLAVLKAGGAFLPVDPGDPDERVQEVVRTARPQLAVSFGPWADDAARLGLDLVVPGPEAFERRAPRTDHGVCDTSLAYVLFTSGSTGRPKGVMVEHRSIVNYCRWVARANTVAGRVPPLPAITRPTFDASIQQLVAPLTRGDAVWLVPEETREDPELLLGTLRGRPGAGLHCVPALWDELLRMMEADKGLVPDLSALFLGGDRVAESLWERTRRTLPGMCVANVYGPTETTVQVTGGFQASGAPLSVGCPVDNVTVSVHDPDGRRVGPGVPGEVYIGGAAVARGYLGEPELTAERFLQGSAAGLGDGRVYRTGDLGVLLPEGQLRILGRLDNQLKIRGFRIEPREVEAALCRHPDVRDTVVVASPATQEGTETLCAAVIGGSPGGVAVEDVSREAARWLPEYMLPSRWRVLDRMPLTPNGKVDRRRIAESFSGPDPETVGREPLTTATEKLVAQVLSEVLGRDVRWADDDFFHLGGHSLVATRATARLRRATGVPLGLRTLFEARTVRAIARAVDESATGERTSVSREHPGGDPTAPLSFQQEAVWSMEQALQGIPFNNVLIPVRVRGTLDVGALRAALGDLVSKQEALRTAFLTRDGVPVQRVTAAKQPELTETDLRGVAVEERAEQAMATARALYARPFDLSDGRLLRVALVHLEDGEHVLLLCTHHIVCDGMSFQTVLDDLCTFYPRRLAPGAGAEASPGRPGYLAYARRQRREHLDSSPAADLAYWRDKLTRAVAPDTPARMKSFRFGTAVTTVDAATLQALRDYARASGVTPFMVMAATTAALFHMRFGDNLIRLATLAANREEPEHERTVGLFATTVLLEAQVSGDVTFHDLVDSVRADSLAALSHQSVPLELVLSELGSDLDPSRLYHAGLSWEPVRTLRSAGPVEVEIYTPDDTAELLPVVPSSTELAINIRECPDRLVVTLEYGRETLDASAATSLLRDLSRLLHHQLDSPGLPLAELEAVFASGGADRR